MPGEVKDPTQGNKLVMDSLILGKKTLKTNHSCVSPRQGCLELNVIRTNTLVSHVRQVQVIPWSLGDSTFSVHPSYRQEPSKTVFVGALHGMMSAEALAYIMNDLFGNVVYAGIDTDKHKYPIGRLFVR